MNEMKTVHEIIKMQSGFNVVDRLFPDFQYLCHLLSHENKSFFFQSRCFLMVMSYSRQVRSARMRN